MIKVYITETKKSRTFAAASVPADILLSPLSINTVSDIRYKTAEHIGQILSNEIGALDILRAYVTFIVTHAHSTRRIFQVRIKTARFAILEIAAIEKLKAEVEKLKAKIKDGK